MTKTVMRRLERLEHIGQPGWQTKLRNFARKRGWNEEWLLGVVQGHERQLAQAVGDDGFITIEGFQLLLRLAGLPVDDHQEEYRP
jgi:hypothetical protein